MFSQSPKKASPLAATKLAPAYYYQKLHEDQISHHKKLEFNAFMSNKEFGSKNGLMNKSNFISHPGRKSSNADDEKEAIAAPAVVNSGKKFTGKNATILDFLNKK